MHVMELIFNYFSCVSSEGQPALRETSSIVSGQHP
jgi:hypothetical protein